ncbi:MAG: hypothetical protein AB8G96_14280 [Phycisphaerales bacterium]
MHLRLKTARTLAALFSLAAFATAMIAGVVVGNEASATLLRAIVCLLAAWPIGALAGQLLQGTVQSDIERFREQHPVPNSEIESDSDAAETAEQADMLMV